MLSWEDRYNALAIASENSRRPIHLLEKDVWIVWALNTLFTSSLGEHLVFKGGTSLSKAYGVINRFSEDVDITYDIRSIASDIIEDELEALPVSRSQERKWSKEIRNRLAQWIENDALPVIESSLHSISIPSRAHADNDKIYLEYEPLSTGTGYVRPIVMLEFGARSTGEPWETRPIVCDAAVYLPELVFPTAQPRVMRAERTFWEKATAIHVFCLQGRFRGTEGFARHWHDLVRLDNAGYSSTATDNPDIAQSVRRHKSLFFAEKDMSGSPINYMDAVNGHLRLVPDSPTRELLATDYQRMVDDGLLLYDAETFDTLMERCREIEEKVNRDQSAKTQ